MNLRKAYWLLAVVPALTFAPGEIAAKESVLGIGGMFFRAADPSSLGIWYEQH